MPFTINGIGTSICPARGDVAWGGEADRDSVECLVVLYLPVLPYRVVHSFGRNGTQYHAVPIRWSLGTIARAFFRRWMWVLMVVAGFAGYFAVLSHFEGGEVSWGLGAVAVGSAVVAFGGWWLMARTDQRHRSIRRVLGPHELGSSDPATWTRNLLANVSDPTENYGTATFAEAAAKELASGSPIKAMWAARLATATEDRHEGERLTDEILAKPGMSEAIARVKAPAPTLARRDLGGALSRSAPMVPTQA